MYKYYETYQFKYIYPTYADFKTNVIDKLLQFYVPVGTMELPYYFDNSKMFYKYEQIYMFMYNKYSDFHAVNLTEKTHQLLVNAFFELLPDLYMKTFRLKKEVIDILEDVEEILVPTTVRKNQDPDTNYRTNETGYSSTPNENQTMGSFNLDSLREKTISNYKNKEIRLTQNKDVLTRYSKLGFISGGGVINEFINSYEISTLFRMDRDPYPIKVIAGKDASNVPLGSGQFIPDVYAVDSSANNPLENKEYVDQADLNLQTQITNAIINVESEINKIKELIYWEKTQEENTITPKLPITNIDMTGKTLSNLMNPTFKVNDNGNVDIFYEKINEQGQKQDILLFSYGNDNISVYNPASGFKIFNASYSIDNVKTQWTNNNKTIVEIDHISETMKVNGQDVIDSIFIQNSSGQVFPKGNDFKGLFLESNGQLWPAKGSKGTEVDHFVTFDQLRKKNYLSYSNIDSTMYFQSKDLQKEIDGLITLFTEFKNNLLNQNRTFLRGSLKAIPNSDSNAYMIGDFTYSKMPLSNVLMEINLTAVNISNIPKIGTSPDNLDVKAKVLKIKLFEESIIVNVEEGLIGEERLSFKNYISVSDIQISDLITNFRYFPFSIYGQNYGELQFMDEIIGNRQLLLSEILKLG